jgi:hypothetical protein
MSNRPYVNLVVVSVRTYPLDEDYPATVVDSCNQPVVVPFDVENHPVVTDDARRAEVSLKVGRFAPVCATHFPIPRIERYFHRGLILPALERLHELPQSTSG